MVSLAAQHRRSVLEKQAEEAAKVAPAPEPAKPAPPPPHAVTMEGFDAIAETRQRSLAARHRREELARLATVGATVGVAAERPSDGPAATEYELLLAELGGDLVRLKDFQSVEAKIALKSELIAAYDSHVDATLAAARETGKAVQDEIVTTMLLWRIDISDFERAIEIGEHVLTFGLAMPTRITRTPAVLIAEEVAEAALKADRANIEFPLAIIDRTMSLVEKHDMPDQVRAKMLKARGRALLRAATRMEANPENAPAGGPRAGRVAALAAFRRAVELDKNCGVKKEIERLATLDKEPAADTGTE